MNYKEIIPAADELIRNGGVTRDNIFTHGTLAELFRNANEIRERFYGKDVYLRGLIEFTSYCRNDCYYCGLCRSNSRAERYRLTEEEILLSAENGHRIGFRTFVLQGGEDPYFTDEKLLPIIEKLRTRYPDCAITLSLGERSRESYEALRKAGADRYLLRHETADSVHYGKLHPQTMSLDNRKKCLFTLKEIGFQTGAGFMVGSPFQTTANLISDIDFLRELCPEMVGIGPFISHKDTPFRDTPTPDSNYKLLMTLVLLAVIRVEFPNILLPATTALGTIHPKGREMGILSGANVIMPNLSPKANREKYMLYDGKICTGEEAAECFACIGRRMAGIGYKIVVSRGDIAPA
ncbi:[FeFe] hydrogenase H-cluster radical SAM maturase HydE [Clostridia bacterium]|nr:[FeFe] hydrogenase H-cluster radical SAM maturase HydE [Clostridia bacterium]